MEVRTSTANEPGRKARVGALKMALEKGLPRGKMDGFYVRWFIRWASIPVTAAFYRAGMSANLVSVMAIPIAALPLGLLTHPSLSARVLGAIAVNIWLVLDCVDGNLARINGPHAFGEFLDAISGYVAMCAFLVGLGFGGYQEHPSAGLWPIVAGFAAATANMLLRLTYQKLENANLRRGTLSEPGAARPSRAIAVDFHVGICGLGALLVIPAASLSQLRWLALGFAGYYVLAATGYMVAAIRKTRPW